MKKSLIIVSILLMALAVVFTACANKQGDDVADNSDTSQSVEYSTEENGDLFVTNVNGDHIPVTTNKSGYMELYEDLITKTAEQVSAQQQQSNTTSSAENSTSAPTTTTSSAKPENTTEGVQIGNGNINNDDSHDAIVKWN